MTIAAKSYGFKNFIYSCMAATAHTLERYVGLREVAIKSTNSL